MGTISFSCSSDNDDITAEKEKIETGTESFLSGDELTKALDKIAKVEGRIETASFWYSLRYISDTFSIDTTLKLRYVKLQETYLSDTLKGPIVFDLEKDRHLKNSVFEHPAISRTYNPDRSINQIVIGNNIHRLTFVGVKNGMQQIKVERHCRKYFNFNELTPTECSFFFEDSDGKIVKECSIWFSMFLNSLPPSDEAQEAAERLNKMEDADKSFVCNAIPYQYTLYGIIHGPFAETKKLNYSSDYICDTIVIDPSLELKYVFISCIHYSPIVLFVDKDRKQDKLNFESWAVSRIYNADKTPKEISIAEGVHKVTFLGMKDGMQQIKIECMCKPFATEGLAPFTPKEFCLYFGNKTMEKMLRVEHFINNINPYTKQ